MKHPKDVRYDARPARSKLIPCGLEGGSVALCVGELEDMASPPGLLAVAREKMRTRHLALRTEHAYLQWLRRYLVFHGRRHPRHLGAPEVEQFLTHLAVHRKVSAATQNQALQALLFLYRHVLQIELPWLDNITRASHPRRRPVVLSRAEVRSLLSQLQGAPWLVANLLYGSGLRLMEALRLRVKDLALERGELIVREAKGGKDRVTVLPAVLDPPLRGHLTRLRAWYEEERRRARPASQCRLRSPANTRRPPRNGAGSTCSHPRISAAIRTQVNRYATTCTRRSCSVRCARPASASRPAVIPCVTASPPICSRTATTFVRCRNCSATLTSRPPWSTSMSWGRARTACAAPSTGKAARRDPHRSRTGVCEPANRFCRHAS